MSAYASEYPSVKIDSSYKEFFEQFYATSDTPDAHEKYVENFTDDAILIMASKKVKGSDGTLCTARCCGAPADDHQRSSHSVKECGRRSRAGSTRP